jgi:hypothetical protein
MRVEDVGAHVVLVGLETIAQQAHQAAPDRHERRAVHRQGERDLGDIIGPFRPGGFIRGQPGKLCRKIEVRHRGNPGGQDRDIQQTVRTLIGQPSGELGKDIALLGQGQQVLDQRDDKDALARSAQAGHREPDDVLIERPLSIVGTASTARLRRLIWSPSLGLLASYTHPGDLPAGITPATRGSLAQ